MALGDSGCSFEPLSELSSASGARSRRGFGLGRKAGPWDGSDAVASSALLLASKAAASCDLALTGFKGTLGSAFHVLGKDGNGGGGGGLPPGPRADPQGLTSGVDAERRRPRGGLPTRSDKSPDCVPSLAGAIGGEPLGVESRAEGLSSAGAAPLRSNLFNDRFRTIVPLYRDSLSMSAGNRLGVSLNTVRPRVLPSMPVRGGQSC